MDKDELKRVLSHLYNLSGDLLVSEDDKLRKDLDAVRRHLNKATTNRGCFLCESYYRV